MNRFAVAQGGKVTRLAPQASYPFPGGRERATAPERGRVQLLDTFGRTVTYEAMYRSQPWVFAVVNKIVNGVGRLPLKAYVYGDESDRQRAERGNALDRLIRKPWKRGTAWHLKVHMSWDLLVHGQSALIKDGSPGAPPDGLLAIPWRHMYVIEDDLAILGYEVNLPSGRYRVDPGKVVHFQLPGRVSPLEPLRRTLAIEDAATTWQGENFRNGITPRGAFTTDARLNRDTLPRLREELEALYAGVGNAGRFGMFDQGLAWTAMGVSAVDTDLIAQKKLTREEVCFVPGTMVVTGEGVRAIETLRPGDLVLTHRGRLRPVLQVMERGYDGDVATVRGKSLDPVTATVNHPFLVQRMRSARPRRVRRDGAADWRELRHLAPRQRYANGEYGWRAFDTLTMPRLADESEPSVDLARWLRSTGVVTPATVAGGNNGRATPLRRHVKIDADLGWIVGLFVADGTTSDHQVAWCLNATEGALADRLRETLACVFGAPCSYRRTARGVLRVTSSSRPLADFFGQFGHGQTEKHLAPWCLQAPSEFRRGLLAGMVDGDGCVSRDGYTRVSTTSEHLAWQARLLLWAEGISHGLTPRAAGTWSIEGRTGVSQRGWTVGWRTAPVRPSPYVGPAHAGAVVVEHEVRPYCGLVYNLSVADDESYVTTGGTVHNCGAYDVNPTAVGILERATFSNIVELRKGLFIDTIGPKAVLLESTLNAHLVDEVAAWDGYFLEFDMDGVLRPDAEARNRAHLMGQQSSTTTINERRKLENLPRIDDPVADTVLLPVNMTPVGVAAPPAAAPVGVAPAPSLAEQLTAAAVLLGDPGRTVAPNEQEGSNGG